jgi:carbon-monoxide dehydrogenase medium subunit
LGLDRLVGRNDIILERVCIPAARSKRLLAERSLHPMVSVYLGAAIVAGVVHTARIAVGCAYARPVPVELPIAGTAVATLGSRAAVIARDAQETLPVPLSDGLASGAYRRRMIEVLTRRLLITLGSRP